MLKNSGEQLNIWLRTGNKFDYAEFARRCKQEHITPLPLFEFAQKAGLLSCAALLYPQIPLAEAYLRLIEEHQQATLDALTARTTPPISSGGDSQSQRATVAVASEGCGSCGGGSVR